MQSKNKYKPYKKQEYIDAHFKINAKDQTNSYIRRTFRDNIKKAITNDSFDIIEDVYALPFDRYY